MFKVFFSGKTTLQDSGHNFLTSVDRQPLIWAEDVVGLCRWSTVQLWMQPSLHTGALYSYDLSVGSWNLLWCSTSQMQWHEGGAANRRIEIKYKRSYFFPGRGRPQRILSKDNNDNINDTGKVFREKNMFHVLEDSYCKTGQKTVTSMVVSGSPKRW